MPPVQFGGELAAALPSGTSFAEEGLTDSTGVLLMLIPCIFGSSSLLLRPFPCSDSAPLSHLKKPVRNASFWSSGCCHCTCLRPSVTSPGLQPAWPSSCHPAAQQLRTFWPRPSQPTPTQGQMQKPLLVQPTQSGGKGERKSSGFPCFPAQGIANSFDTATHADWPPMPA
uniref:Uncharacterized protein n=1 Tax=Pongo abelii TaxID=9601 RepID=A0A8I5TYC7_PONAB